MTQTQTPGTPVQRVEVSLVTSDSKGEEKPATGDTVSERWTKASESVQTTAKWVITALAAVGAVMFAKGFVSVPTLSYTEDRGQLVFAWILGVVGVLGIGLLIWATSQVLFPTVLTLQTLPRDFTAMVAANPEDFLPTGANTVDELRKRLLEHRQLLAFAQGEMLRVQLALKAKQSAADEETQKVQAAQQKLLEAKQQNAKPDTIAKADEDLTRAKSKLQEATGSVTKSGENLERMRRQAEIIKANVDLYVSKRQEILDRAQFWKTSTNYLHRASNWMLFGAALAAIGGIGFQLALTTPPPDDTSGGGSSGSAGAAFPRTAQLVQLPTEASAALWDAAELTPCELTTDPPTLAVVLLAGKGTDTDPWSISTIPTEECPLRTFPVINDVALIVEEPDLKIEYTPTPTPSPTAN